MEDFDTHYWNRLWGWYVNGGYGHVAAYLRELDLSTFDPKAPPRKTAAFWEIVNSNRSPEDAELADALDLIGNPEAITVLRIAAAATDATFTSFLRDPKTRRQVPHRLENCGYVPVRNEHAKDGLWKIGTKRQVIYAKSGLSVQDRMRAAAALSR